jgi:hypothetical protein
MKKLSEKIKSINYKYFFQELIIVVAGILIALSLNSWREDNIERNRELFYLKSLKADFEQTLNSLTEINNQNLESKAAVQRMIAVIEHPDDKHSTDSLKSFFRNLFGFNRFVPASGTYKEIISSGSLQILTNDELRIALSSWEDKITRNRQLEEVMFWQYHLINIPYLNKHIARSDFNEDYRQPGENRKNKTDFKKLITDTEFENILFNRAGALEETNEYMVIMIEHVKHIINLIDKDITD